MSENGDEIMLKKRERKPASCIDTLTLQLDMYFGTKFRKQAEIELNRRKLPLLPPPMIVNFSDIKVVDIEPNSDDHTDHVKDMALEEECDNITTNEALKDLLALDGDIDIMIVRLKAHKGIAAILKRVSASVARLIYFIQNCDLNYANSRQRKSIRERIERIENNLCDITINLGVGRAAEFPIQGLLGRLKSSQKYIQRNVVAEATDRNESYARQATYSL
ncbi:MAG: hypothetical protein PHU42_03300 [Patescibacteria group bacterium]|nr:hypothetical protein [Patescibacteria group bacterium]